MQGILFPRLEEPFVLGEANYSLALLGGCGRAIVRVKRMYRGM